MALLASAPISPSASAADCRTRRSLSVTACCSGGIPVPAGGTIQHRAAAAPARTEQISHAFNVDTAAEGNLQRATRDDIESTAPGARLHSPGSGLADILKERRSDLSESPWLFLLLLLVLIAEPAMAVRLSYHLSGAETGTAVNLGTRTVT